MCGTGGRHLGIHFRLATYNNGCSSFSLASVSVCVRQFVLCYIDRCADEMEYLWIYSCIRVCICANLQSRSHEFNPKKSSEQQINDGDLYSFNKNKL
jgi:hypothetical protein